MKTLLLANHALLEQAATLVAGLDDADYTRPMPAYDSGSVGQHLRHVFDHYEALLGRSGDLVDYDLRRRDSRIEDCRVTAQAEIRRVLAALNRLQDGPVRVRTEISPHDRQVVEAASTVRRELVFATSHAVHHFALIAMLLRVQGIAVPRGFGVAPATLTHQRSQLQPA